MIAVDRFVEVAQERYCTEVFPAAVDVGNPLAVLAPVVEIEHRGDRIDAKTVDVLLVEPEQRARQQESAHLVAVVVENRAVPLGVETLPGVSMFVEIGAI